MDLEECRAAVQAKGAAITALKKGGVKDKASLKPHIDELIALKSQFKELNGGVGYDPPKEKKKKKKTEEGTASPASGGGGGGGGGGKKKKAKKSKDAKDLGAPTAPAPTKAKSVVAALAPEPAPAPAPAPALEAASMPVSLNGEWPMIQFDEQCSGLSLFYANMGIGCYPSEVGALMEEAAPAAAQAPAPAPASAAPEEEKKGEEKLSKKELKRRAKGKGKDKVKKDKVKWNIGGDSKKDKKKAAGKAAKAKFEFTNTTVKGEKPDMMVEMPNGYEPRFVEAAWQDWWEASGFYAAKPENAIGRPEDERFIMVIPPPNVTGSLHLGHALTTAVEDTLCRWHRMRGDATLWVPGTDHAGIATQSVVEKMLKKNENLTRHDLGRDAFVKRVWEWKESYGNRITKQLRLLGASVDWEREAFTMDSNLSRAVTEAFVRFHDDGILYRDNRLVNWSCALRSAISAIEVDHIDLTGITRMAVPGHTEGKKYEFGALTEFAYKVVGLDEEIIVATTRLETMLGDTAVAVHPKDPRYEHLHGKFVQHPFVDRQIPIVLDDVLVDMEFGTGAVKITPAHDPNDYQCGKRHNLDFINILNENGSINDEGGEFAGMMRYDAREAMEARMRELGIYRDKKPNPMSIGVCSRSKDIIEPYLTPQWWVDCKGMAARSVAAVRNGELKIVPNFFESTWYRWLDNIQDWCISRQLWWGHRIPAYYATDIEESAPPSKGESNEASNRRWVVARTEDEARTKAAEMLGCPLERVRLEQDEDVLDTWFSSGLFPFSVFGWPNQSEDLEAFYPTSILETGHDILFFWVARMVMMGLQLTDKLPFHTVYLHAMVRDKTGRKMSKSLGNVIDPLEVIYGCPLDTLFKKLEEGNLPTKEIAKAKKGHELDFPDGIPECGSDALRFGLLAYTCQGRDVNLDIKRVVGYRNFCNKLWQVSRFCLMFLPGFAPTGLDMGESIIREHGADGSLSKRDRFILSRLNATVETCEQSLRTYAFAAVTTALHGFWLYDLCDRYVELIKPIMRDESEPNARRRLCTQKVLWTCLDVALRLSHPVMPLVTEELWQRLPGRHTMGEAASIMIAPYPSVVPEWKHEQVERDFEMFKDVVTAGRSQKEAYSLKKSARPPYHIRCNTEAARRVCSEQKDDFATLVNASSVDILGKDAPNPRGCAVNIVSDEVHVLLEVIGHCDFVAETAKLRKQATEVQGQISNLQAKLDKPGYEKCKDEVKLKNDEKMSGLQMKLAGIETAIVDFERLVSEGAGAGAGAATGGDNDEDDLFGDDDEEEKDDAAAAARAEERKKKAQAAKDAKKKAAKVQKTQCVFEVKPYELETDLVQLYDQIKQQVVPNGCQWGQAFELVPVAYGIKKLVIQAVIEDDKVLIDDIVEPIEEMDDVQSIENTIMQRL